MHDSLADKFAPGQRQCAWQGLASWVILDIDFNGAQPFLNTWLNWLGDSQRPRVLHYVGLCPVAPSLDTLLRACDNNALLGPLAQELAQQWFGLMPGFHRFLLAQGQLTLTLCVGDAMHSLSQQPMQADEVVFSFKGQPQPGAFDAGSVWFIKALANCSRRGTLLHGRLPARVDSTALHMHLSQCGFNVASDLLLARGKDLIKLEARFDPPWVLKKTRQQVSCALPIERCAIIGAGLAGASVAASLARRGWQVQVLDQAATPAAGASGLPVGLLLPHVTSDDGPLSRLSRSGVRMMLQQAQQHLQEGRHWSACGVLEREINGTPQLPIAWTDAGQDWSLPSGKALTPSQVLGPGIWHAKGAWLKPAQLVQAWLGQSGVHFQGHAKVSQLRQDADIWHLLDDTGRVLCSAERVVFASAFGTGQLLASLGLQSTPLAAQIKHLPTMQGMRGLLNWAVHTDSNVAIESFPPFPVNGFSSLVPGVPTDQGKAWFMGSTYQPLQQPERCDQDNQNRNFAHLQKLLPALANDLQSAFASDALKVWKNIRCVTSDRLPLVGPLDSGNQPSLWLCSGLGSRGLSFSVLCAELLAAKMGAEPLPVEAKLAKLLTALRA